MIACAVLLNIECRDAFHEARDSESCRPYENCRDKGIIELTAC